MARKPSKKTIKVKSTKAAPKKSKKAAAKKAAAKKTAVKKVAVKKVTKAAPAKAKATTKKPRKRKKKNKDVEKHYVNAKEFYEQIKEYYKTDVIPNNLAESLVKIATGLSYAPNFINYSWKDEMVGDAILKMFSALKHKKFKVETGNNPFSYFTTIAYHAFINRIKKESKHRDTITRYQESVYSDTLNNSEGPSMYVDPDLDGEADY
tara:strand:+ start:457 stop:1077 length:621 start_codon:yes stop_codon:yes gene_type:complete